VGGVGLSPDLHGGFQQFADQALVMDASGGGLGHDSVQHRFGDAHFDAG
jgi:hypothetical protein